MCLRARQRSGFRGRRMRAATNNLSARIRLVTGKREKKNMAKEQQMAPETASFVDLDNMPSMEQLLGGGTVKKEFAVNNIVSGKVVEKRNDGALVDIGYKAEGFVSAVEFGSKWAAVAVGDNIDVYLEEIENENSMPGISFAKASSIKAWNRITEECGEGSVVKGVMRHRVKGGIIVDIDGVEAFLPGSQIDIGSVRNMDDYLGKEYEVKILKINTERRNIVVSRRDLLEETMRARRSELLAKMAIGELRRGMIKNITDFGAFIDLDGMDGLLHITDMSWGRISHPSELLKQGEEIEVMIIEVNREKERVSLGLKQTKKNPWDDIDHKYPVGAKIRGKVVNLVPYGAFVEIEPGVEGLVHVTEMSWTKRIAKPSDILKVGQELDAVILGLNREEQKISLGMRQLEPNPWDMVKHNYPVGARVRGKVRNMTTYGAFIELEEGIDGMVHVSDMSWTRKVNHPSEVLKKGDEVDAVVLDVDPNQQRISLGMKQLAEDPWSDIDRVFKIGDVVTGTISKITSFGAFVELKDGIDGLVHISQIQEERVEKIKDVLKPGQEVTARVVKIDREERRLGLSIKAANYSIEQIQAEASAYDSMKTGNELTNLGDILDEATKG